MSALLLKYNLIPNVVHKKIPPGISIVPDGILSNSLCTLYNTISSIFSKVSRSKASIAFPSIIYNVFPEYTPRSVP